MAVKDIHKLSKRARNRIALIEYTYLGCPLTKNRSPWCFRVCQPKADGTGSCGRIAPHSFKSRIQQGIEDFKRKQAESLAHHSHHEPLGTENRDQME